MKQAGQVALAVGLVSLALGIVSRMTITPIAGVEAHAFLDFTQACFLFGIAAFLGSGRRGGL